jgi:hypothetical protein
VTSVETRPRSEHPLVQGAVGAIVAAVVGALIGGAFTAKYGEPKPESTVTVPGPTVTVPGPTVTITASDASTGTAQGTGTSSEPSAKPSQSKKPPSRKVYHPSPNLSYSTRDQYTEINKVVTDREANLVTVYFESHGDEYPLGACITQSDYGIIHQKDAHYDIEHDKYQKGSFEFQLQGPGKYTYNNACDEDGKFTDVYLFKL